MLPERLLQALVCTQKMDHLSPSRTRAGSEMLCISSNERPNPAPLFAERAARAFSERGNSGFAGKQRSRQYAQKGRTGSTVRQRSAPTSHALREHFCTGVQGRSRAGLLSYSGFPGVAPERLSPDTRIRRLAGLEHSAVSQTILARES